MGNSQNSAQNMMKWPRSTREILRGAGAPVALSLQRPAARATLWEVDGFLYTSQT